MGLIFGLEGEIWRIVESMGGRKEGERREKKGARDNRLKGNT